MPHIVQFSLIEWGQDPVLVVGISPIAADNSSWEGPPVPSLELLVKRASLKIKKLPDIDIQSQSKVHSKFSRKLYHQGSSVVVAPCCTWIDQGHVVSVVATHQAIQ